MGFTLDIGGEGRHAGAWNLNISRVRTIPPRRGEAIPRLILARADEIPLPDCGVDCVIVERMALRRRALLEVARIVSRCGTIILRHAVTPVRDPHAEAVQLLGGRVTRRCIVRGARTLQETRFQL